VYFFLVFLSKSSGSTIGNGSIGKFVVTSIHSMNKITQPDIDFKLTEI